MHRLDYVGYVNVKQVNQLKFTATPTEIHTEEEEEEEKKTTHRLHVPFEL